MSTRPTTTAAATDPLPLREAARALGMRPARLRGLIAAGAPVARRGSRGRGHATLVCPAAVREWLVAGATQQFVLTLAAELPAALAAAMEDALRRVEGSPKDRAAGLLAGAWYLAACTTLDVLRGHCPAVPDVRVVPPAIERLRAIERGK